VRWLGGFVALFFLPTVTAACAQVLAVDVILPELATFVCFSVS
jgi:hypothetical protein